MFAKRDLAEVFSFCFLFVALNALHNNLSIILARNKFTTSDIVTHHCLGDFSANIAL